MNAFIYQGVDKDTFVFIGVRGQVVYKHRLSFYISTLLLRSDVGEVDVCWLLQMLFVTLAALMDDDLGYKSVQDFRRPFCNVGVLFSKGYQFVHITCRIGKQCVSPPARSDEN